MNSGVLSEEFEAKMSVKDYRELNVYKLAFESAVRVYELSKSFPPEEKYSLTDQNRRSSRAVCANLAEAWRKRRYPNSFVAKLSDADAEAAESSVWLDFALRFKFVEPELHAELTNHYNHICSQLAVMMSQPEKWAPRNSSTRKPYRAPL